MTQNKKLKTKSSDHTSDFRYTSQQSINSSPSPQKIKKLMQLGKYQIFPTHIIKQPLSKQVQITKNLLKNKDKGNQYSLIKNSKEFSNQQEIVPLPNNMRSQKRSKSKNADLEYVIDLGENNSNFDFENPLSESSYRKPRPLSTETKRSKKMHKKNR